MDTSSTSKVGTAVKCPNFVRVTKKVAKKGTKRTYKSVASTQRRGMMPCTGTLRCIVVAELDNWGQCSCNASAELVVEYHCDKCGTYFGEDILPSAAWQKGLPTADNISEWITERLI